MVEVVVGGKWSRALQLPYNSGIQTGDPVDADSSSGPKREMTGVP